jgi:hypothetical protein
MVQAELVHSRWAMLGVAGILFTAVSLKRALRRCRGSCHTALHAHTQKNDNNNNTKQQH